LIIGRNDLGPVIVVDFDWSRDLKSGVYYPTALLNKELVDPEDPDDLAITKERHRGLLNAALKKLNESSSRR
jgi:hypothetical protein